MYGGIPDGGGGGGGVVVGWDNTKVTNVIDSVTDFVMNLI